MLIIQECFNLEKNSCVEYIVCQQMFIPFPRYTNWALHKKLECLNTLRNFMSMLVDTTANFYRCIMVWRCWFRPSVDTMVSVR